MEAAQLAIDFCIYLNVELSLATIVSWKQVHEVHTVLGTLVFDITVGIRDKE